MVDLAFRSGQQGKQAEYDRTGKPYADDQGDTDACPDLRTGKLRATQFVHARSCAFGASDEPPEHERVEEVEKPQEAFPNKTAFELLEWMTALRAGKRLLGNGFAARWAWLDGHSANSIFHANATQANSLPGRTVNHFFRAIRLTERAARLVARRIRDFANATDSFQDRDADAFRWLLSRKQRPKADGTTVSLASD